MYANELAELSYKSGIRYGDENYSYAYKKLLLDEGINFASEYSQALKYLCNVPTYDASIENVLTVDDLISFAEDNYGTELSDEIYSVAESMSELGIHFITDSELDYALN